MIASWHTDSKAIEAIRRRVFIEEQKVPETEEWDEFETSATHVLATATNNLPVATGRLHTDGKISRIAVLPAWRGRGIARMLIEHLLTLARNQGIKSVYLHAQTHVQGLYRQFGFVSRGEPFREAGIAHVLMVLPEHPGG